MTRKFRPIEESLEIVVKMLREADYYGDASEIDYWTRRYNGYAKLAIQKNIPIPKVYDNESS